MITMSSTVKLKLPDGEEVLIETDEQTMTSEFVGYGFPRRFSLSVTVNAWRWTEVERAIALRYFEREAKKERA